MIEQATATVPRAKPGHLFIISGPSGAGKGTLVSELVRRDPSLWVSVSVTTRAARPGEVEGLSYTFLSGDAFDALMASDGLLEWAEVHGNRYGTPRAAVQSALDAGRHVLLEIDPQGAFQVKERLAESVLIFIMPPSKEELLHRLTARGSENPEQIATRMKTAERELELVGKYDHVVINDSVPRATDELARIIASYEHRQES